MKPAKLQTAWEKLTCVAPGDSISEEEGNTFFQQKSVVVAVCVSREAKIVRARVCGQRYCQSVQTVVAIYREKKIAKPNGGCRFFQCWRNILQFQ